MEYKFHNLARRVMGIVVHDTPNNIALQNTGLNYDYIMPSFMDPI